MTIRIGKYYIDAVWHFTDRANLEFIKKYKGILSLAELEKRQVSIPKPSGNNWSHEADKRKGLHKFVHLAFINEHPMLYIATQQGRIENPIWIKIEPSIILEEGVLFCSEVANKSNAQLITLSEVENQIDLEVLFTYMDWTNPEILERRKLAKKSEILIPNMISITKIMNRKALGI